MFVLTVRVLPCGPLLTDLYESHQAEFVRMEGVKPIWGTSRHRLLLWSLVFTNQHQACTVLTSPWLLKIENFNKPINVLLRG